MPGIPATQQAEIRRIMVASQLRHKISKNPSQNTNVALVAHAFRTSYREIETEQKLKTLPEK
jgi:hypothetical protein